MNSEDLPKILCVDDEPQVLEGLERTLFEHFDVFTADSGKEALDLLDEDGPFPVVVSDMRMPEMDGAEFLTKARHLCPDTVRILLTGHADIDSAISAVNDGQIFRFLCKPCDKSVLVQTLEDSVEMHRLLTLERELLANTLKGAVQMMARLLELSAPTAFQKANAVHEYVSHVCKALKLDNAWVFESAALLSRSGYVVLPIETADRIDAGKELAPEEVAMLAGAYQTAANLVREVPRMGGVADIIEAIGKPPGERAGLGDDAEFGVQLLEAADVVDRLQRQGVSMANALKEVEELPTTVRVALLKFKGRNNGEKTALLRVNDLLARMVLDQDVLTECEVVVARKQQELTRPMIDRIRNFDKTRKIQQPIRVIVPESKG